MVTDPIKFVYLVGDGVTTDFSYAYNGTVGFDADVADDVKAAILNPDGTRDINPNFAVMQDTYGNFIGKIRFAVAPVANAIIYIYRATPQTQETEYKTSSGFDAQNVEKDFDKLTKLAQETASHTRNKTLQLDMFQEAVLKLILTSSENQNQMLFIDFENLTFKFTDFTKGQAVITPAAGSDDKTDLMLRHQTDNETGSVYLAFSIDQGKTWNPMNFAEIKRIVDEANENAAQALENSEQAVETANSAAEVANGIDGKAQQALDNSETAVSTANDAKAVADGIDAKAQEALDNSETNALEIKGLQGAGGALTAYNFNAATPTQETLTKYAVDQIWPGNTNWAWNAANPAASTFTDANGVARTAAEIFNSTWVNNTYDDHRWQLTNTQNTEPKVFEWADVGRDIVSVATATTAGIVRVGSGSQMVVNPSTGDISLDGTKAAAIRTTIDAPGRNVDNTFSGAFQTFKLTNLNFSITPTTAQYAGINFNDASGVRLGVIELSQQINNTKRMSVGLVGSTIRFDITSGGVASQMLSANPPSDSSSTQIATTQWVKQQLLNIGATMVPDYSRGVGISLPYTVPENGWIYVEVFTQEKYVNVQVNGQIVVEVGGSNNSRTPIPFFCLRGDVIQLNVDNASAGGRFFPVKVLESAPATVYKVVNSASSDTYYLSDKPFGLDDINNTEYLSSIKLYSVNNRYRLFNYVVTADSAAGMILIKKPDGTTDTNSLAGQGEGFYAQEVAV